MYAVEFNASIENGRVNIPNKYQNIKQIKEAHIIIMINDENYMGEKSQSFAGAFKEYSDKDLIENEKDIAWDKVAEDKCDIS